MAVTEKGIMPRGILRMSCRFPFDGFSFSCSVFGFTSPTWHPEVRDGRKEA